MNLSHQFRLFLVYGHFTTNMGNINTTASTKKQKQNNKNVKLVKSYPCSTLLIICLVGRELHSESRNIYFFVSKQMCKMFYGNIFAAQTLMDIQLMWLSRVLYVNILYWPQYFSWNDLSEKWRGHLGHGYVLCVPRTKTREGEAAFSDSASHLWNKTYGLSKLLI